MEINTYTDIISSVGVIITLIYLAIQIKNANKIHEQNHEWNRRIETRKALDKYNTLNAVEKLEEKFKYSKEKQPIKIDIITKEIKNDYLIKNTILRLLNYYESLAIGVDMGIYSELIIKETRRGNMTRTFNAFKEYIEYHRRENNPRAFIKYEILINKWIEEERQGVKLKPLGKI